MAPASCVPASRERRADSLIRLTRRFGEMLKKDRKPKGAANVYHTRLRLDGSIGGEQNHQETVPPPLTDQSFYYVVLHFNY